MSIDKFATFRCVYLNIDDTNHMLYADCLSFSDPY